MNEWGQWTEIIVITTKCMGTFTVYISHLPFKFPDETTGDTDFTEWGGMYLTVPVAPSLLKYTALKNTPPEF